MKIEQQQYTILNQSQRQDSLPTTRPLPEKANYPFATYNMSHAKPQAEDSAPSENAADSVTKFSTPLANEPPDGGLNAWLHVLGSFFLVFNTWGIINAFGAYQTYYASGELFSASSSSISWIGSIETCLLLVTGFVSGPFFDRGGLRILLITGCFLIVFGHMMLSICDTYWQVVLAQGDLRRSRDSWRKSSPWATW